MKYIITLSFSLETKEGTKNISRNFTNLKKAVLSAQLNYGTFKNWKSKNKIELPFTYKGFLFEKVEIL